MIFEASINFPIFQSQHLDFPWGNHNHILVCGLGAIDFLLPLLPLHMWSYDPTQSEQGLSTPQGTNGEKAVAPRATEISPGLLLGKLKPEAVSFCWACRGSKNEPGAFGSGLDMTRQSLPENEANKGKKQKRGKGKTRLRHYDFC